MSNGLSMSHFTNIGQGVLNPQRSIQDSILNRLKQTAMRVGKSNLIYDINKAHAKKKRIEDKTRTRESLDLTDNPGIKEPF